MERNHAQISTTFEPGLWELGKPSDAVGRERTGKGSFRPGSGTILQKEGGAVVGHERKETQSKF